MNIRLARIFVFLTLNLVLLAHADISVNVNDRISLKATHHAGVPVHNVSRGTHDFRRVPDDSKATVLELAPNQRWLRLKFDDQTTGWITKKYVARKLTQPSDGAATTEKQMQDTDNRI